MPRQGGGLVLAVRDGIAVASDTGDGFELAAPVERDTPGNRMNDAKCDPAGRLLAGTTAFDFTRYSAALYRVEPDWSFEQMVRDVTQSNGIAWSPDGKKMYFIDSATQGVDVFDYEAGTGSARNRRRLVTIERAHGVPDGMTTDSQGNLWVTCFGGAAVRCFSPEGEQLRGGVLSGNPGNQLRFRGPRAVGPVCDLCRLSVERGPVDEGAACGCDVRLPSRSDGHARVVVRRLSAGPPDQRTPSEVARLMAEEREVAPSFM